MLELEADAVLFDSDGVLIDSHEVVEAAWRQLSNEFGLDGDRVVREQAGVLPGDTLSRYLSDDRVLEAVERLEALELDLVEQVGALPGASRLVHQIRSFPCAIVTSGSRQLATARWEAAGIEIPRVTVTADDVTSGKPDPAPYLKAAELLEVVPSRCVVFEDSPAGGAAASTFGGSVVAVGDQAWPVEPTIRINNLEQVSFRFPGHPSQPGILTVRTRS